MLDIKSYVNYNHEKVKTIETILFDFYLENANLPGYPEDYCNIASRRLMKILSAKGLKCELKFTYQEEKDGHTFIMTDDGYIIDPTYGQYDTNFKAGYVGRSFPNEILQKNIMNGEEYMKKQLERYSRNTPVDLLDILSKSKN